MYNGFYPAKIISYDSQSRTCRVSIEPFTRGSSDGKVAKIAYPIGHDDLDTEIYLQSGMDVYVFFEMGQLSSPVVAFCRSHGVGAVQDVRRIRQKRIELIAEEIVLDASTVKATGNVDVDDTVTANSDVIGGGISLKTHPHGGIRSGSGTTTPPLK